jgi:hypothetical protein
MAGQRPGFTTHLGGPLEPRDINRSWYAVRSRAGLQSVRLHDLRHSCASFLLAAWGFAPHRDEDSRTQPDRADDDHLYARAARNRTGRDRRCSAGDLRVTALCLGCKVGCITSACARTGVSAITFDLRAGERDRTTDLPFTRSRAHCSARSACTNAAAQRPECPEGTGRCRALIP